MLNGKGHRYIQHHINYIPPRALERLTDRALIKPVAADHLPPYIQPVVNYETEIFAPHVDVTRAKVAFGRWAIPKLRKELRDPNPLIVKQALCSLLDLAHDPEQAVQIISLHVITWLVKLMISEDAFIRQKVLKILSVIAGQPGGKHAIVRILPLLENISLLMSDKELMIRLEAASTLEMLARGYIVVRNLIQANFIPLIINRLEKEVEDVIVVYLLTALELLIEQNDSARLHCLDNKGCELAVFLEHMNPVIRAKSATVLTQLFVHPLGKEQAYQHRADILQMLTICLDDEDEQVKISAAGALMFALTTTPAKNHCLTLNLIPRLLYYTQASNCPDLQRNCIKALTNMAEAPAGRASLLQRVDFLKCTDTRGNKDIKDHLKTLIDTILWSP